MQKRRPVMLVVLDGWGWREDPANNAVRQAKTPTFDRLWNTSPHGFLRTSGLDVGLPPGQMGNSEVGHLNIGAGRVVQSYKYKHFDIVASELPDNLEVDCMLDVSLPQDNMQNANIDAMLSSGENPLVSQEWIRSNLLHLEDNSSMTSDVWREQAANLKKQLYYQEQMALSQAKMQMELAKMQQQNAPPQQPMPGQGGPEMPPQAGGMPPEVVTMPPRQPLPSPGMPQPGGGNAEPV